MQKDLEPYFLLKQTIAILNQPLKFTPILHKRIWGGDKLHHVLGKKKSKEVIGESWEISTVQGSVSLVTEGRFKGWSLQELIKTYKSDIVGDKVYKKYGANFPLLIKFIDAKTDLSVQLHPNNQLAKERHNSLGKDEMWYVMRAEAESKLYFGFNRGLTKTTYSKHLLNKTLPSVLHQEDVKGGEVYYIPAGRVHAIGGGVLLVEIQQSSDITYRIYDWDRKNPDGAYRDLHTDLALDAIDFDSPSHFKTHYKLEQDKKVSIAKSEFFTTNIIQLTKELDVTRNKDSFRIYICVEGEAELVANDSGTRISMGETLFVPAVLSHYKIYPKPTAKLLEVFIGN